MEIKSKPLGDRVLLKLEDVSEKKSSGGIILQQRDVLKKGTVVSVSDGFYSQSGELIKLSVDIGDTVVINEGTGQKLRLDDGNWYQLVRESEILIKN